MAGAKFIQRQLFERSFLSDLLYPASRLYGWAQKKRFQAHSAKAKRVGIPVIGIGNISSGGSGKTPFCIALAKAALKEGWKPAISHRGYKGKLEKNPSLISGANGAIYPASTCGDEAWLMANALPGVRVAVGKDRLAAIEILKNGEPQPDIILLDDAFQNHKVHQDIRIACFDADLGIGNGRLLPAGYLRENLQALKRAKLCVITRKNPMTDVGDLKQKLGIYCPWVEVLDFSPSALHDGSGKAVTINGQVALVSAIASPDGFEKLAARAGISWKRHFIFWDHYHFRSREALKPLFQHLRNEGIRWVCCTAKDYPKLMRHRDLAPFLAVLEMEPDHQQVCAIFAKLTSDWRGQ